MLKKAYKHYKRNPATLLLHVFVVGALIYAITFSIIGFLNNKNSQAQVGGNTVYVPDFGACRTNKDNAMDTAVSISNWINNRANVPNGTPANPTIVKFSAKCYEIESTIFFDGGASIPFKNGSCAHLYQNPSPALCANTRQYIVFDGSGTQFMFLTNGNGYKAPPGDDFGPDPTYGFAYNDIKWYILGGANLTFQNINMQGPQAAGSQYFVSDDGAAGMEISGSQYVTVQNNTFSHVFSDFIDMIGYHPLGASLAEAPASNITIQNNNFYAAGRDGISPVDANNVLIQHNTIMDPQWNTYDLEDDDPAWAIDNIVINGDTDNYGVDWFVDTGGSVGFHKGPDGSSANITVENNTVKRSLSVFAGGGYKCSDHPLTSISFINNTATGVFNNGSNDLMSIRCAAHVDIENNYSKVTSYNSQTVIDVGTDDGVTIKNNTFPQTDESGAPNNPRLNLIGKNNAPTGLFHCGNNISHQGTGALYDGVCGTSPPPPVCPQGTTGTPPNCQTIPVNPPPNITTPPTGSASGSGNSSTSHTTSKGATGSATNSITPPILALGLPPNTNLSQVSKACYYIDKSLIGCVTKEPFTINLNTKNLTNGCHVEEITIYQTDGTTSSSTSPLCINHKQIQPLDSVWVKIGITAGTFIILSLITFLYRHKRSLPWSRKNKKGPRNPNIIVG